ncbi:hypothetical protein HK104_008270 [Borealophlyctis nickersoniae]|nr:hypothetical protein HK104_008270 [Borealophlyctis nickersoniae]
MGDGKLDDAVDAARELDWFRRCTEYGKPRDCYEDMCPYKIRWDVYLNEKWDEEKYFAVNPDAECTFHADSDEEKRHALSMWVDALVERCGHRAKDFANHVDQSVCPPESLHPRIQTLIKKERARVAMPLLEEALQKQNFIKWGPDSVVPEFLADVFTPTDFAEAKLSIFESLLQMFKALLIEQLRQAIGQHIALSNEDILSRAIKKLGWTLPEFRSLAAHLGKGDVVASLLHGVQASRDPALYIHACNKLRKGKICHCNNKTGSVYE